MAIKQPPLAGVHVLVTRPAHQARMLCHLLEGQGAEVSCAPALQIVPLQSAVHIAAIEQAVASLDTCHIVIFVSVNAAELAIDCFLRSGVVLPDSLELLAVGKSSADFLQNNGIKADYPVTRMDSEGLLALPVLQAVAGKRVLIFRGQGGRELIADTLTRRGAIVDSCVLYERQIPQETAGILAKLRGEFDVLLVNSAESLQNLLSLVEVEQQKRYKQKHLVVPGPRVAEKARAQGFSNIITAENATDPAVCAALIEYVQGRGLKTLDNN